MSSNFRTHLLSLSLLVGVAVPWAATAQAPISNVGSGSIEDRVTSLERISNAHSQLLTQLQQQLSDNQNDIDSLRGQIQENQYQLNQVADRQKQILLQMDSLSQGNAGAARTGGCCSRSGVRLGLLPQHRMRVRQLRHLHSSPCAGGDANSDYNAAIATGAG